MGPFQLMDATTSSLCLEAQEIMHSAYQEALSSAAAVETTRTWGSRSVAEGAKAGLSGRKAGSSLNILGLHFLPELTACVDLSPIDLVMATRPRQLKRRRSASLRRSVDLSLYPQASSARLRLAA